MAPICPNCGKSIKDEEAIYCPYYAKRLKESPHKSTALLATGAFFVLIGVVIVILVEPKIDPNWMPWPAAPAELFAAGIMNIVAGIILIAYGLLERLKKGKGRHL